MNMSIILEALDKALLSDDFILEQLTWKTKYCHFFRLKIYSENKNEVYKEFEEFVSDSRNYNKLNKIAGFECIPIRYNQQYINRNLKVEKIDNESFWFYFYIDRRKVNTSKYKSLQNLDFSNIRYRTIANTLFRPLENQRTLLNKSGSINSDKWLHYEVNIDLTFRSRIGRELIEDIINHYGKLYLDVLCKALVPLDLDDRKYYGTKQDTYINYDFSTHNLRFFYKEKNPYFKAI